MIHEWNSSERDGVIGIVELVWFGLMGGEWEGVFTKCLVQMNGWC